MICRTLQITFAAYLVFFFFVCLDWVKDTYLDGKNAAIEVLGRAPPCASIREGRGILREF